MSRILHRSTATPPIAANGQGIWLRLADGQEVIDASGGAAVACLGHGNLRVAAAIAAQAGKMAYAHTGFFTSEPAEALAEILLHDEPGGLSHAYFCSSGSEGNEAALKLARQYFVERGQPERTKFIGRRQSYHGNTLGALGVGGNMARRAIYEPILAGTFSHVSPCFPYRFQSTGEMDTHYVDRLAAELEAEFQRLGPQKVIGFFAETMVGATTGCVAALPGYFKRVREICDRHGALLILDEVMCGMGRLGVMHAWELEGISPDIQVIAKGLGSGYQPIGGILIARRVVEALRAGSGAFTHGHTYQAHPVACAAALEVQRIIRDDHLLNNVQAMGARLEAALIERFGNHRFVGDIRGRGLFWALEFVSDRATKTVFNPTLKINDRIKRESLARGLAVYPMGGTIDGTQGDHVIVAPPYIATAADIDMIVDRLGAAVDAATT
ncbi:MAG: aspartate aminotransferase family protein [Acetobacteraceae bacterium]|nr:aspartate aminotransferase family protein [Acetobacteraceae bacterium]MSP30611.1 aspartate aminotransferase family protein [Acetobacteraceae bacterium]